MILRKMIAALLQLVNLYLPIVNLGILILIANLVLRMERNYVFDTDKARAEYRADVEMYYQRGCSAGTRKPPDKVVEGWNINSPTTYCRRQTNELQDAFNYSTYNFIRKNYQ